MALKRLDYNRKRKLSTGRPQEQKREIIMDELHHELLYDIRELLREIVHILSEKEDPIHLNIKKS